MNVGFSIWDKLTRLVMILLLGVAVVAVEEWYRPVVQEDQRLREKKLRLEKQIERETEIAKKLDNSIRSMQDPRTIERFAREKLSYAKAGENVIIFDPPATNTTLVKP